MVDEKVAYIFAKEYTLDCKDKVYLKSVQDVLGKRFKHFLMRSGYAASNHGIAWWHPYVDEQGKFKIMLVPASKCLPEWTDNNHEELKAMHYIYDTVYYDGGVKKYRTHVETWTADGYVCRVREGEDYIWIWQRTLMMQVTPWFTLKTEKSGVVGGKCPGYR